jgi:hypothetical protein
MHSLFNTWKKKGRFKDLTTQTSKFRMHILFVKKVIEISLIVLSTKSRPKSTMALLGKTKQNTNTNKTGEIACQK